VTHPFAIAGVLAVLLAAALNLAAPMPPLQDFNEWLYQGWIVAQVWHGEAGGFALKSWPVPNAAAQFILGALNLGMTPWAAGVVFLTACLAAGLALCRALAVRDGRFEPATFLLLLSVAVLNAPYWLGFANFQLGLLLLLLWLLRQRRGGSSASADAALGVAIFFCHAVILAVFALLVGLRALRERHILRAALVLALPMALLGWYVAADRDYGETIPPAVASLREFVAYKAYSLAKSGPYHNMVVDGMGDAERAPWLYWGGVALNLAFALGLGAVAWNALRAWRAPLVAGALLCLAAFAVLPSALFGVVNIGERVLLPGLAVALVAAPDPAGLRRFGALVAATMPVLIAAMWLHLPPLPNDDRLDHLAHRDPAKRYALLFWIRPWQFQAQFEAARQGRIVPPRFSTSILTGGPPRDGSWQR
jgi:hypothetical protein